MNKNKYIAVLSSTAISLLITCGITTNAHAKVVSYVIRDNDKVISFNLDKLLQDYTNSLQGVESPMFDEYEKNVGNLVAFEDTEKGLVSSDSVINAYADMLGQNRGNEFNLDAVTENAKPEDIQEDIAVTDEWAQEGIVTVAKIDTVSAVDGEITVKLTELPTEIPTAGDLIVTASITDSEGTPLESANVKKIQVFKDITDVSGLTYKVSVPAIEAKDYKQIVIYTVNYKATGAKSSVAFTVDEKLPTATVEQAGTAILGKTVVVASLPETVDATKYDVSIDNQILTYNSSTKKFSITLNGTYAKDELQEKIIVTHK